MLVGAGGYVGCLSLSCCLSPVSSLFLSYTRLRSLSNPNPYIGGESGYSLRGISTVGFHLVSLCSFV